MLDLPAVMLYDGTHGEETTTTFGNVESSWGEGFRRSSLHFVDALVDGTPAEMSAEDAIKALQLCFAVYQAGNTGERVDPRTVSGAIGPRDWPPS